MTRKAPRSILVSAGLLVALLAGVALNAAAPPTRPPTPKEIEGLVAFADRDRLGNEMNV